MTLSELAPAISAGVALLLRLGGERLGRPAPQFCAGAAGMIVGWGLLQGPASTPPALAVFELMVLLAAGCGVTSAKPRGKSARRAPAEAQLWLALVALFGGWWLAGGGVSRPGAILAGMTGIGLAGLLAADAWAVAAASLCLAAALLAVAAPMMMAAAALVVTAACLGGGPLLPLAAGLGSGMALVLDHALLRGRQGGPLLLAALAPLACLLLLWWWRRRFVRFGRAAGPVRAAVAAGLICLLTFSAAAMEGLR